MNIFMKYPVCKRNIRLSVRIEFIFFIAWLNNSMTSVWTLEFYLPLPESNMLTITSLLYIIVKLYAQIIPPTQQPPARSNTIQPMPHFFYILDRLDYFVLNFSKLKYSS